MRQGFIHLLDLHYAFCKIPGSSQFYSLGRRRSTSSCAPFFTRLPYDIRALIYSHLTLDALPPLAPHFPNSIIGFASSCRQAQQEIDELASCQLQAFLSRFKTTTTIDATITRDPKSRRNIIVTLPYSACESWNNETQWKPNILIGLHPLFAQPFDLIRIHFTRISSSASPSHSNPWENRHFTQSLHTLLSYIAFMISCINVFDTSRTDCLIRAKKNIETQGKHDEERGITIKYPSASVVAKRICLSYDFRPRFTFVRFQGKTRKSNNVFLSGTLHQIKTIHVCKTKCPGPFERLMRSCVQAYKALGPAPPPLLINAARYTLCDGSGAVGEVGLVSPTRWDMTWDYGFMDSLMWEEWRMKFQVVECRGLGGEIGVSGGKG
jgi:hypothetical protein